MRMRLRVLRNVFPKGSDFKHHLRGHLNRGADEETAYCLVAKVSNKEIVYVYPQIKYYYGRISSRYLININININKYK